MAGTGWQAYPDLAQDAGPMLRDGQMLLPHAEDMLPLALHAWQAGRRWRWSRRSRSTCAMK